MINIRNNLFETNSSSVHAICIGKNNVHDIPNTLYFKFGEYGWEQRYLCDPEDLASYLYTAIYECNTNIDDIEEYKNYIYEVLGKYDCECRFEEPTYDKYGWLDNGYIDHGYELKEWLDGLRHSEKKLLRYLFSPYSYIVTTNDNTYDLEEYLDGYLTENSDKYDVCMKYN